MQVQINSCIVNTFSMLKNIAISERNYVTLKSLGKAGDSFNDVICKLIKEMHHEKHDSD